MKDFVSLSLTLSLSLSSVYWVLSFNGQQLDCILLVKHQLTTDNTHSLLIIACVETCTHRERGADGERVALWWRKNYTNEREKEHLLLFASSFTWCPSFIIFFYFNVPFLLYFIYLFLSLCARVEAHAQFTLAKRVCIITMRERERERKESLFTFAWYP